MTTKLDKPIIRELALEYEGRRILLEILPGDPAKGALETFRFRLKGTSAAKHTRSVTVRQVLEAAGWAIKIKIPKAAVPAAGVVMTTLGPVDVDQLVKDLEGEHS
ncbi:MAG TPA: hypothetical protein VE008_07455 [Burkholderiales bacterium]|nr:hypothetical protein [Burkholderiales bacterium]